MDIKAVQTEAGNKATAWLTQNLPTEPQIVAEPVTPAPVPPAPAAVVPVITPPAKPGMAEAIRQDREARAAASSAQQTAEKYKTELETVRKENESLKALGAASDPFEFLKYRKLSKDQQALWGQAFLYDLKPEVAPPEFRLELYKAEQARQKEVERAEQERFAADRAQQEQRGHLDRYADELLAHVQSTSGSNPESELWFTEDGPDGQPALNHRVYAQSLLATANNLQRRAQQTGQQVDLSPANIARVLEAEVSKRQQRRDAKRASSAKVDGQVKSAAPAQSGTQATVTASTSAEGLRGGPPLPPDVSEEARRARAAAVLFGTK